MVMLNGEMELADGFSTRLLFTFSMLLLGSDGKSEKGRQQIRIYDGYDDSVTSYCTWTRVVYRFSVFKRLKKQGYGTIVSDSVKCAEIETSKLSEKVKLGDYKASCRAVSSYWVF